MQRSSCGCTSDSWRTMARGPTHFFRPGQSRGSCGKTASDFWTTEGLCSYHSGTDGSAQSINGARRSSTSAAWPIWASDNSIMRRRSLAPDLTVVPMSDVIQQLNRVTLETQRSVPFDGTFLQPRVLVDHPNPQMSVIDAILTRLTAR